MRNSKSKCWCYVIHIQHGVEYWGKTLDDKNIIKIVICIAHGEIFCYIDWVYLK